MRVIVLVDEMSAKRAVPLCDWLARVDGLEVDRVADARWSQGLPTDDVVVALVDEQPLAAAGEQALAAHMGRGGGLVLLGATLHAWRDATVLTGLIGKPGECQAQTELVVEICAHAALRRVGPRINLIDRAWLDSAVPPDADPWLRTSWHFRDQVLGWSRERLVVLTLGSTAQACADERVARLVLRAVRHASGLAEPDPLQVGMLGYGAIGTEHTSAVASIDGLGLGAICDRDPSRLAQASAAATGARLLADAGALMRDEEIDLVLVSVPPHRHAEMSIAMLRAGKHVVVEKPFALTLDEAERMRAEAAVSGRSLTVYQNRRWDPDFRAIRHCVRSGRLGDVFHIETFVGVFAHPCSYWHSHEPISGGLVYDWGSHYVDWILQVVDAGVTAVSGAHHKRVWHDVTNADMARVSIRFEDGREAEFVHSDIAAAPKPKWYVLGTRGAITAEWRGERLVERRASGELVESSAARTDSQAIVRVHTPDRAGGSHVETLVLPPRLDAPFHRNLADHLLTGEPLEVTVASAAITTAVLEAASVSARSGGEFVRLSARVAG
ncbi:MAG: Gfo/Idh/MocA family protein [Egibacteraceae bacterium]